MKNSRRTWLKQTTLAMAGISLAPLNNFGIPVVQMEPGNETIRLSSNENPYGPSPLARKAMADAINISNRYQWGLSAELVSAIAAKNNVTVNNVITGAGSTEMLDLVVQFLALKKGSFVLADLSFSPWSRSAEKFGLQKIVVPLTARKEYDFAAMLAAIRTDTTMVHICNPNNPTGVLSDRERLLSFVNEASKRSIVLVDEAYLDYTNQDSLSSLVNENPNLVIVKTFSKIFGMAGARLGYLLAHPTMIAQLAPMRTWTNGAMSAATLAGGLASLKDNAFTDLSSRKNDEARKYTMENMEKLGIPCIPSSTNFIYFSLAGYNKDFFGQLQKNNIIGTRIFEENGKWSRITIGTLVEMQLFISAIS